VTRLVFAVTRGTDIAGIEIKFGAITRAHPSRDIQTRLDGLQQMEAVMNFVSTKREHLIPENPVDPRTIRRDAPWNRVSKGTPWNRIVAVLQNPDFAVIVMLCTLGLLATTFMLLELPHFGQAMESVQQLF
jgi:hypothetical protein